MAWHLLPPIPRQSLSIAETSGPIGALKPAAPAVRSWNWTAVLAGIYLAGVAVFLVRLALGTLQVASIIRRASRRDGNLLSDRCGAPVTAGWFRPVVILPESWSRWPGAQLDAVLTHEREHARRRDPLFQWIALLNRAVFWFHPLA
jgi:D-alanyl-D-alanine endopeptidase (penicillin-binding protein 7)